ncbi:DUF6193 family natural product biosynthesis protein [Kitasatospora sp. NPDC048286]|uniref:DUF6193 family natural product biosynthesis protein n=1 Tax=Kitasatospora sp. NPDC048286 TaxID=3364047 RepID=UPI003717562A
MPEQKTGAAPDDAQCEYATHYPDVASAGSLTNALRAQADRAGHRLAVEPDTPADSSPDSSPGRSRREAHVRAGDRSTHVWMAPGVRSFSVSCWTGEIRTATGSTDDLAEVTGAMHTWHSGARIAELLARRPFLHTSELAEAHERGEAIPVRWRQLREHTADERTTARHRNVPALRELVEAAYAHPRLRALSPGQSMSWITFSRRAAPPICRDLPRVMPTGDHTYRIRFHDGRLQEVDGAAAAVEAIVAALPDDAVPA